MPYRKHAIAAAGAVIAALLTLSGCASAAPSPHPTYRVIAGQTYAPPQNAQQEYSREASSLTLPPSNTWPKDPIANTYKSDPQWYQLGYGKQAADRYWYCSWAGFALSQRSESQRKAALEKLPAILNMYYYKKSLVSQDKPQLVAEVNDAQHGKLSALAQDVAVNCPQNTHPRA